MKFTLDVACRAERDVSNILQWLSDRSQQGAANWLSRYRRTLNTLLASADAFGVAPEASEITEDLREITFKTRYGNMYRLVFLIRNRTVHVLRVRNTGQPMLAPDDIEIPEEE